MSEKIEMTITINELVSPLLFERLSSCSSARRRAAVLKALAESALRRELTGHAVAPPPPAANPAAPAPRQDPPARQVNAVENDEFLVLSVGDGSHDRTSFDDALHDQLGAWM
ncbi:hypothetical protein X994_6379 (plasmid) [Burkholderia pseudomallei]|uniref:hypothetical protein n=1 Tax=Burkholderia pseudomallei TaxID=28450 RepID=UPI00050E0CC7|nr:hypothetical protein [Burkholderia pseudomallei]AIV73856.1 hypothetical protein X994_6379 [Burkholderia pseudomallei]KGC96494.1 hypothetical protein DP62_5796 [Burkholderia pseudomallei]KGW80934.1 hypothetical protein Y048_4266 [Burkholderia pseudomallei MSHR456]MBF3522646.1 hypothetical protein [Burkholderia pseudomallei]OMW51448.1 hypothetical protein AQ810_10485 [Burkholderia pseudomallei]